MRGILESFTAHRTPASIVTKSTLVLRDLDLLVALHSAAAARVNFSVTTLDLDIWRSVEPGTPPPAKRLQVLQRLVEAGVPCGVFLAPILPGLTDREEAIDAVAAAARAHGATWFWASPLRLAPRVKEHYLNWVTATYPHLLSRYESAYPRADPPQGYTAWLDARVASVRARHGFAEGGGRSGRLPGDDSRTNDDAMEQKTRQLALHL